jgi:hypothetical protein
MVIRELFLKTKEEQLFSTMISWVLAKADGLVVEGFMFQVPCFRWLKDEKDDNASIY